MRPSPPEHGAPEFAAPMAWRAGAPHTNMRTGGAGGSGVRGPMGGSVALVEHASHSEPQPTEWIHPRSSSPECGSQSPRPLARISGSLVPAVANDANRQRPGSEVLSPKVL